MPTEPMPRRSDDELMALVRQKAAVLRHRRSLTSLGAGALVLLLLGSGVALAGNGGPTGKRTVRVAGETPTTAEETTTSTNPTTTTTEATTTSSMAPRRAIPATTAPRVAATTTRVAVVNLTVELTASPPSAPAGSTIRLTAHIRDGARDLEQGTFDFGDGSQPVRFDGQASQASGGTCAAAAPAPTDEPTSADHTYAEPGRYVARITVTDTGRCTPPSTETASAEVTVDVVPA